jgi:hypothetical protein
MVSYKEGPVEELMPRPEEQGSDPEEDQPTISVIGFRDWDDESLIRRIMGAQRGTGRTYQSQKAVDEGLAYVPPRDPATVSSEKDPQGIEVAAGFAPSMEDTDPETRILPDRIARSDLEIQERVGLAMRYNSETSHLRDLSILVSHGIVNINGTVASDKDIASVYAIVSSLDGVRWVNSHLQVGDR